MSIVNFIRDLIPSFKKNDVREKLRIIARKITDVIQPSLDLYVSTLDEKSFKSAYAKKFLQALLAALPQRMRNVSHPYGTVLAAALGGASRLVDQLDSYVSKNLGDTVHIEGITYQKATVLRLIELLDFFTDYASRQLTFLVASETNIEAFGRIDGNPFTPAELRYLVDNQTAFLKMLNLLTAQTKEIMDAVGSIPEVLMGDTPEEEIPALAGGSADPLRLGSIPGVSGIFHWVGLRMVDWDVDRYEAALKSKRTIELRLESLRQKRGGNLDAQTESLINGYERELSLARATIAGYEEKAR